MFVFVNTVMIKNTFSELYLKLSKLRILPNVPFNKATKMKCCTIKLQTSTKAAIFLDKRLNLSAGFKYCYLQLILHAFIIFGGSFMSLLFCPNRFKPKESVIFFNCD